MSRHLSITVSDHVYDTYLSEDVPNKSQYIERLIILGSESLLAKDEDNKKQLIKIAVENQNLLTENQRLKMEIGKLQDRQKTRAAKKEAEAFDPSKPHCLECKKEIKIEEPFTYKTWPAGYVCFECSKHKLTSTSFRRWNTKKEVIADGSTTS